MRLSRLGTDSSLPPDYQGFRAASELGRSILAAGQPSSCRPTTDRGCKAAIQGAAPRRRIRRRDQGRAIGDESASRNRKFESTPPPAASQQRTVQWLRRALVGAELRSREREPSDQARFCGPPSRLAHNWDGTKDARQGYLSSQTCSMRQLLIMLLTIIVHPFTCGCQQYAKRL
jgi:hypothetical protein